MSISDVTKTTVSLSQKLNGAQHDKKRQVSHTQKQGGCVNFTHFFLTAD